MAAKYGDSLLILGISFASAWVCEGISWLLIYRTSSYKSLRSTIDRTSKKLETMKSNTPTIAATKKSKAKKMDRLESGLKESSRDLSFSKFKSGGVVAVVLVIVFGLLSSLFEGKPVAKLPFTPLNLVQTLSHRGVPGDDPTDCSMVFLYTLCSLSIRSNLQKFLGFSPPRGAAAAGMFPVPLDTKSKTQEPVLKLWLLRQRMSHPGSSCE
ncbi:hypothetical protein R1sor_003097 [Riccia sorocarpa]|uniref:Calcium load-activated calcium channel n=1 Tax=Riccia sorocarpa TaxID=122646 RepID=A0ABD3H419_9MARC